MRWKKGNPKEFEYTNKPNGKAILCLVRLEAQRSDAKILFWGKTTPAYRLDLWYGNRWSKGNSGIMKITHHLIIKEPK